MELVAQARPMKKVLYILIGILLFLWFINPTLKEFKDFVPTQISAGTKIRLQGKEHNYLILSVYKLEYSIRPTGIVPVNTKSQVHSKRYIGIAMNFYEL